MKGREASEKAGKAIETKVTESTDNNDPKKTERVLGTDKMSAPEKRPNPHQQPPGTIQNKLGG